MQRDGVRPVHGLIASAALLVGGWGVMYATASVTPTVLLLFGIGWAVGVGCGVADAWQLAARDRGPGMAVTALGVVLLGPLYPPLALAGRVWWTRERTQEPPSTA